MPAARFHGAANNRRKRSQPDHGRLVISRTETTKFFVIAHHDDHEEGEPFAMRSRCQQTIEA